MASLSHCLLSEYIEAKIVICQMTVQASTNDTSKIIR